MYNQQQETSGKSPIAQQLRKHLDESSPEQLKKEWAEVEAMGFKGPTVDEFLKSQKLHDPNKWIWLDDNCLAVVLVADKCSERLKTTTDMKQKLVHTLMYRSALTLILVIVDIAAIELWNRPELIPSHVMGAIWTCLLNVIGLFGIAISWFTRPGYSFSQKRLRVRKPELWLQESNYTGPNTNPI